MNYTKYSNYLIIFDNRDYFSFKLFKIFDQPISVLLLFLLNFSIYFIYVIEEDLKYE